MAKPMFFCTGVYDNVAVADADYEAIRSLHRGGAIGFIWDEAEQEALAAMQRADAAPAS